MEEEIQPTIIEKNNHKKLKSIIILSIILAIVVIALLLYVFVFRDKAMEEAMDISPLRIDKTKVVENPTEEDIQNLIETLKLNNNFNQD